MPTLGSHRQPKSRRTQAQRSAEMRVRLLDATIDCLVEYGYAGTTTPRVAEKAGVTRGAQVHHFPSKTELVIAAIRHLAAKRAEVAIQKMGAATASEDPIGAVLDLLWDVHQGPVFVATVELWVAGRADPTLAREMAKFEPVVTANLVAGIAQVFPGVEAGGELRSFFFTAMDVIRGILISNFVEPDATRAKRQWDRASAGLLVLGAQALQSS
ncbi:AcrR family transcriptional regulator [Mycobacterium sp. MAA66]|uniref:TetR/AcrR family transcriptional regulator n=1 Tax=Mycobacterium sp. MAA66 TaxID=3156297 RepID=UPI0035136A22